ncbi:MAG: PKD domain-containing protein, partial [Gammaproteobacteria bacterium]
MSIQDLTLNVPKNPLGQTTQITDPAGNNTVYTYKPFSELTQIVAADGGTTTIGYNPAGNRTSLSDGDRGTLTFTPDSLGEIEQEIKPKGKSGTQAINYAYDALGRLSQRTFPAANTGDGTETQGWSYYPSGSGAGQLESESDSYSGYSFNRTLAYDSNGELATQTDTLNGSSKILTFAHDSLGRLATVTYPVSVSGTPLQADYNYDSSGSLSAVTNHADGTVYWQPQTATGAPDMNAFGQMEAYTLGGTVDVQRQHDPATGAVARIMTGPNLSTTDLDMHYGYDVSGNTTDRNDTNSGLDESFGYDTLQRLTSVAQTTLSGTTNRSLTYDAVGQFTQGPAGSYVYGQNLPCELDPTGPYPAHSPACTSGNQAVGTYAYDAAGQRTQWSTSADDNTPVVNVSASPTSLTTAGTVTLSSTGTYDPDNGPEPLSYQWTEAAGPSVPITNSTSPTATASLSINGTYTFQLTVSDSVNQASASVTVSASIPPAVPINLHFSPATNPITSGTGSYTVDWDSVPNVSGYGYTLQESTNGGSWHQVYPTSGDYGSATQWSASSKANGTYAYRVMATNGAGQSSWSSPAVTMSVAIKPDQPTPPTFSPSTNPNGTGSYTVKWLTTNRATSYVLQESINGGSWAQVYPSSGSGPNKSWSASGKVNGSYKYRVEAINSAGGTWSASSTTLTVLKPPANAPSLWTVPSPDVIANSSYTVDWGTVTGATDYQLEYTPQESAPGVPNWSGMTPDDEHTATHQNETAPPVVGNHNVYYRIEACNGGGCSAWSAAVQVIVEPEGIGCGAVQETQPQTTQQPQSGQQSSQSASPQIGPCNGTTQTSSDTGAAPPAGTEGSMETQGVATVASVALPSVPVIALPPETLMPSVPDALPDVGITLPRSVTFTDAAADTTHGIALRTADSVPNAAPALQTTPAAAGSTLPPGDPIATWDGIGQVRTLETPSGTFNLNYGPDGDLIENTGTDGGRYMGHWVKLSETNNDWHARIIVNGAVVAVVASNNGTVSTSYLIQDALGSTAAVTNEDGTVTTRIAYDAWGNLVNPADGTTKIDPTTISSITTVGYTGQE